MADSSSRTRVRSDQRCAVSHLQHEFFSNSELNISHNYFDYTLPLITVEVKNNHILVSGRGGGGIGSYCVYRVVFFVAVYQTKDHNALRGLKKDWTN